ncbi:ATP-binding protein [Bacillus carboniphilus]|uniref:histidine kinase n=1 Tax=Bacillus carboniphilus TaxID=86663 RepID=A0ABY9JPG2_9BACI|nr:ATP-binding protein [Bacillus carboniphilus]WLR41276.1 ATP-binding protein [Bacillus carboniphilus]
MIKANKNHLKQVFINLIKNSIESMSSEGKIDIEVTSYGTYIDVSIKDEGGGIPPGMLEKLGEPFFTTKDRGTGLGLTVCYKIIKEEHLGDIQFESIEGKGTNVYILLPAIS